MLAMVPPEKKRKTEFKNANNAIALSALRFCKGARK